MSKRSLPPAKVLPPQLVTALDESRLVILLGAGVSQAAGLPSSVQLRDVLKAELLDAFKKDSKYLHRLDEVSQEERLQIIAQAHKEYFGNQRPYNLICQQLSQAEESAKAEFLRAFRNLPTIRDILTTNYDCLLETTLGQSNCQLIYRNSDLRQPLSPKLNLYKLHGTRTDPNSLVLTEEDYREYQQEHEALIDAVKTLLRKKDLVVIGFSMEDSDFGEIYARAIKDVEDPQNFFISPTASLMQELHWARKGFQHVPLTAQDFLALLEKEYDERHYNERAAAFPEPPQNVAPPAPTEPLTNPFILFDTEALIEERPRFLFETFVKPVDFPVLLEHQHTIIEGHRGSGKSTILWRLSLKARAFGPADLPDLPMWGFYIKMVPGLFTSFRKRATDSKEEWIRHFTHYLNLILFVGILQNLEEAIKDGVFMSGPEANDVIQNVGRRLLRLSGTEQLESLRDLRRAVEEAIDTTVNDRDSLTFYTGPTFLSRALERLCEAYVLLEEKSWHVLLDEYDNVYPEQQAIVNVILRERHPKLRYKIAVKTLHMNLRDIDDKTLDPTDDFGYVSCDSFIWDKKQKAKYEKFLEEISNQRLRRSGYPDTSVTRLLPEDDEDSEKSYAGFRNYCLLSSGLTRQFLELCKDAVYEAFPESAFRHVDLTPIPPRVQRHVARVHSAILFKSFRSCRYPQRVLRLFTALGPLFWAISKTTENQSEYRTPLSFEITELDKLSEETQEILEDAIKARLLQFPVVPKKPHNPRTEGPAQKYSFHRLLAPLFGLSLNERYTVSVRAQQMNRIWTSPDQVREELMQGYRAKGIDEYLEALSPRLFTHESQ
ncbi:MAG: SIR2 family protein [Acidobacteriia bacterium]|nr:SIR2 family protein [Terriglobia bacterium]